MIACNRVVGEQTRRRVKLLYRVSIWFLALSSASGSIVYAQAQSDEGKSGAASQTAARLQTSVHLTLGRASLPQITAALSAQTGLHVEAAPYLQERRQILQINDVSARDALDALTALNDWTWKDVGEGHIIITRYLPLLRQEAATIPLRMQAALPRDMRNYFHYGYVNAPTKPDNPESMADFNMQSRPTMISILTSRSVVESMLPNILNGEEFLYAHMNKTQQEGIVAALLGRPIQHANLLLNGETIPLLSDSGGVRLVMQGNLLAVTSDRIVNGRVSAHTGFAVPVKP